MAALAPAFPPARAQDAAIDPPARVARLSRLSGEVSSRNPGDAQWSPAVLNFPFAAGDALWTQAQAQADIELGTSLITLADRTELDLATLDDQTLVAAEPQGALFLDLRDLQQGETYTINTPRGAAQFAAEGEYEILAGDAATPTRVVVVRGAAQLTSGARALRAGPGQMAVATGSATDGSDVGGEVEPLTSYDPFLTAMLARNSLPVQAPPATEGMTGVADLAQYGNWQPSTDYGQVWVPQVAPGWVPYRDGRWSYVEPWGWTWVDAEPWGFAPFHYGRWAQLNDRWCWVPGEAGARRRPAYAPALVTFLIAGAAAGAAVALLARDRHPGRGDIGWVPLGPREAYVPPYRVSNRIQNRLNPGGGWHQPRWGGSGEAFRNRAALTIAPAAALAGSQPLRHVAFGLNNPAARGFRGGMPVQPLRGGLPVAPHPQARPAAPGPATNAAAFHRGAVAAGQVPFRGGPMPGRIAPTQALPHQAPPPPRSPPLPPSPPGASSRITAPPRPAPPPPGLARVAPLRPSAPRPVAPVLQHPRLEPIRPAFRPPAPAFRPPAGMVPAFRPPAPMAPHFARRPMPGPLPAPRPASLPGPGRPPGGRPMEPRR